MLSGKQKANRDEDFDVRAEVVFPERVSQSDAAPGQQVLLFKKSSFIFLQNLTTSFHCYLMSFDQEELHDLDRLEGSLASFPIKPLQALKYGWFHVVLKFHFA